MNFLNRAWLSVTRRKGKSLLLFAIIFIISNVIAGAISVQQASHRVEEKIKYSMGATATIDVDYKAVEKEYTSNENFILEDSLKPELIEQIGQSSYVKYFDYNTGASLGSETLTYYIPDYLKEQSDNGMYATAGGEEYHAFAVKGVQYPNILDIEEKRVNLIDGRVLTQEEVDSGANTVLISKQVADLNKLKVGDPLTLSSYGVDYSNAVVAADGTPNIQATNLGDFEFEIIGIFEAFKTDIASTNDEGQSQGDSDKMNKAFMEQSVANTIYAPNKVALDVNKVSVAYYAELYGEEFGSGGAEYYTPVFILNKPEDIDAFKEENQALVPEYYMISASSDQYDAIAGPVQSMSKLAGYVLIVAILAAILIITLVVLLFLRDRKHELGIYLSFGEKRTKVYGQILMEVLLIAFIAITLAVFTGNLIANGLSATLIQNQLESQQMTDYGYVMNPMLFGENNFTTEDVVAAYKVSLTPFYALLMYGVGLGTTLLATLAPLAYILRLNPKKIMM
ncbi:ABC transporter permease [Streptococcus moroccensis]|uniref:ABC transport system permease protein n=1 Tax=Streptococcus moroccensis TaxID=1451356 RepID=A0ABT9YQB6_9STRE|nr:ABC transporter permease [Streptococcus moroccensis]MDQ0221782.1 putative ABC transport system permease protein [Streptococcus moroccensis]